MALIIWLLLLLLAASNPIAEGVWMVIPITGTKCFSEMLHSNVVVWAKYYAIANENDEPRTPVSVKVTSPNGSVLHHQKNSTSGQWGFTTRESGEHTACFWHDDEHTSATSTIGVEWRSGVLAKVWESAAKKGEIDGVELELVKLEKAVKAIRINLGYLIERESEMREVSENTNGRVVWFSMMSVGLCIGASCWQIFYLKRYLQKKKLI